MTGTLSNPNQYFNQYILLSVRVYQYIVNAKVYGKESISQVIMTVTTMSLFKNNTAFVFIFRCCLNKAIIFKIFCII